MFVQVARPECKVGCLLVGKSLGEVKQWQLANTEDFADIRTLFLTVHHLLVLLVVTHPCSHFSRPIQ